jgi:hypothetical protein
MAITTFVADTILTAAQIMSKARRQIGDQSTKGALIGLCVYGMVKQDFDPMLIALLVPIISAYSRGYQQRLATLNWRACL